MKTKFLYIGGMQSDQRGAIGTHTSGVLKALDESHTVSLNAIFYSFAVPDYYPQNTEFAELARPQGAISKLVETIKFSRAVNKKIAKDLPDFIYTRFDLFLSPLIVPRSARLLLEYNDVTSDQIDVAIANRQWGRLGRMARRSQIYKKFIKKSEQISFSQASHIVCITSGIATHCEKITDANKCLVMPNASNAASTSFLKESFIRDERLIISHVGTLTYWDGLEELLYALALAKNRRPDFKFSLNIIGDGALKERLACQVSRLGLKREVNLTGAVSHEEAISILANTDVVPLLKTIASYDLSPIKYYEAMALGCHVLASDIKHINEAPPICSSVVSFPLNTEEIAAEIERLYTSIRELRKDRGSIVEFARNNHTWKSRVDALLVAID